MNRTRPTSSARCSLSSRAALAKAKRNGDFEFFKANNDFSDVDKMVADMIAIGALKLAAK